MTPRPPQYPGDCQEHERKQLHTGGNIWICPECELDHYKENPDEYEAQSVPMMAERMDIEGLEVPEDLKKGEVEI